MLIYVPLSQIDDNPFQRRREYGDIPELAERIAAALGSYPDSYGLMQIPRGRIVVDGSGTIVSQDDIALFARTETLKQNFDDGLFRVQLAFGHRRLRAFRHLHEAGTAGYEDGRFPVHVDALTDKQMLDAVWSENRERKDIAAVEEAELLEEKLRMSGGTQKSVAEEWGIARATVTNLLALLKLPEPVQEANRRGVLSARQCGSLATVARIGELASGVKWGGSDSYAWQTPIGPDAYIRKVIENPDITSDQIRDVTKRMLDHAGVILPDAVARHDYSGVPESVEASLVQHQCKGCAWRINQHCLNGRCVETKTEHLIDLTLSEASADLRLPVSHDPKHFDLPYSQREALETYWTSGATPDPNLVIGWQDSSGAVRLFSDNNWISRDDIWDKDGDLRNGVILGYKDPKRIPVTSKGEDAPDIADEATRDSWAKQVGKVRKTSVDTAKSHLRAAIENAIADPAPLIALIQPVDAETTDDASVLLDTIVEFLWKRGSLPYSSSAAAEVTNLNAVLRRAGAEPLPALSVQERAAVALTDWYRVRAYTWDHYRREKETAAAAIEQLRQEITINNTPDFFELSFELDRAADDVRRVLGEGKVVVDSVICADCGDMLERDTEERCSCGAVVCEDCYVERGHVNHDEERDALYDDLVEAEETAVEKPASYYSDKPATFSNVYGAVQLWMIHQRLNDIPGQLELMLAIEEHGEGHELWNSMIADLPDGWHDGDLYTAISEKIAHLEELVKTAVSEEV